MLDQLDGDRVEFSGMTFAPVGDRALSAALERRMRPPTR